MGGSVPAGRCGGKGRVQAADLQAGRASPIIPDMRAPLALLLLCPIWGCPSWACRDASGKPGPSAAAPPTAAELEKLHSLPPKQLVEALLQTCHGPRKGRETMGRVLLELGPAGAEDLGEQAILASGRRMRYQHADGEVEIATPTAHWRAVASTGLHQLEGEAAAQLDRRHGLLRACVLAPLYRAVQIEAGAAPGTLRLRRGKAIWELHTRGLRRKDGSAVLVPDRLQGPAGAVRFLEYFDSGAMLIPSLVELAGFGTLRMRIKATDLVFDPRVFDDPLGSHGVEQKHSRRRPGDTRPPDGNVVLRYVPPRQIMIVEDDSADWPARIRLMNEAPRILGKQGQEAADLNYLYEDGGKRYIGFPFQPYDKPFVALPEQRILRRDEQKVLVLYARPGPAYAARVATAREALEKALRDKDLRASGPLRVIPYLDEAQGRKVLPDPGALDQMPLRLELPVF